MSEASSFPADDPTAALAAATQVAAGLAAVRERIAAACRQAGRPGDAVTLVAVSKTYPAAAVAAALAAGQSHFGENRVQEAAAKFAGLRERHPALRLHIIGALQTNKAREAVRIADVIESLDRPRLADAIADAAEREGRCPALLVQVNVGEEAQKAGVGRAKADTFIDECRHRFGDRLAGVMGIPPVTGDPAEHFAWLAGCAARHGLGVVSMGMSADFASALGHGATHVRIGSASCGHRDAD